MESRSTFRKIVTDEAWQYKVRKEREIFYSTKNNIWDGIDTTLSKARVRPVTRKQAEKIILEYEWLGTLPICSLYYGIFFDNVCGGVCCIAIGNAGAGVGSHGMYGVERHELGYLVRGACAYWTPKGSASKLISQTLKQAKEHKLLVMIAYSDTDAGEYGTVYQSTNWICLGKTNGMLDWVHKNGRAMNAKVYSDYAKRNKISNKDQKKAMILAGWTRQKGNPKVRYCYILADGDKAALIKNRIKHLVCDYPKRPCAQSIDNDASTIQ